MRALRALTLVLCLLVGLAACSRSALPVADRTISPEPTEATFTLAEFQAAVTAGKAVFLEFQAPW